MHSMFLYLWPSKEGLCSPSAQEEGNPTWCLSPALGARREGSSLPARGRSDEVENEVKAEVLELGSSPTCSRGVRWLREELLGFMQRFRQRSIPLKPVLAGLGFLSPRSQRVLLASQLGIMQLWVPNMCQLCLCWSCLPSSESQRCASACCDGIFLNIAPKPLLFGKMLISSKLMVDLEASKQPLQSPSFAPALPELRCDLLAGVALY